MYLGQPLILLHMEHEQGDICDSEIEVDESYFSSSHKGKRGWGAAAKMAVFGLLKCRDQVYTAVIENAKSSTLLLLS
jgi:transposase